MSLAANPSAQDVQPTPSPLPSPELATTTALPEDLLQPQSRPHYSGSTSRQGLGNYYHERFELQHSIQPRAVSMKVMALSSPQEA